MLETIPIDKVADLLKVSGHTRSPVDDEEHRCVILRPPEEIYLTIALEPDVTLKQLWRERFFLCRPDPEPILKLSGVSDGFRSRWVGMISGVVPDLSKDVLSGLATWTAGRLHRLEKIFVWTSQPIGLSPEYRPKCFSQIEDSLGSSFGSEVWQKYLDLETFREACVLDPEDKQFPFILAAFFLFASQNFREVCFVGSDGSEAFVMHHHDKVIASIPGAAKRHELLRILEENTSIFENASGYYYDGETDEESIN